MRDLQYMYHLCKKIDHFNINNALMQKEWINKGLGLNNPQW